MVAVGNLGGYQLITTAIKRLGGPTKAAMKIGGGLVAILAGTGAISYSAGEKNGEKKAIAKMRGQAKGVKLVPVDMGPSKSNPSADYLVAKDATSSDGTSFATGDKLRVMDSDGDAVMVERIGDENSPYWVSRDFLESISGNGSGSTGLA